MSVHIYKNTKKSVHIYKNTKFCRGAKRVFSDCTSNSKTGKNNLEKQSALGKKKEKKIPPCFERRRGLPGLKQGEKKIGNSKFLKTNDLTKNNSSEMFLPSTAAIWSATHCNTLQHNATRYNILQHTAAHCNTMQHTATHCNALQHTATH